MQLNTIKLLICRAYTKYFNETIKMGFMPMTRLQWEAYKADQAENITRTH